MNLKGLDTAKIVPIAAKYMLEEQHFNNEVCFLQHIRHVNILKYYGFYSGPLIIVTELCDLNLHEYICNDKVKYKTYKLDELVYFAKEVETGLEYLHDRKMIHNDISGRNIFLISNSPEKDVIETTKKRKSIYNIKIGVI